MNMRINGAWNKGFLNNIPRIRRLRKKPAAAKCPATGLSVKPATHADKASPRKNNTKRPIRKPTSVTINKLNSLDVVLIACKRSRPNRRST